jgi:hypothetical protein
MYLIKYYAQMVLIKYYALGTKGLRKEVNRAY